MSSLDEQFVSQVEVLLSGSINGSCLHVRDLQTSAPAIFCEKVLCDHFKLHIPYAGYTLVWEVRFDSSCPDQAPDFLFDDDAFTSFLNIDILCSRVPSLEKWDLKNSKCLSDVVQELLNLHTFYQLKRLEKDGSPLSDECSKLVQEFDLMEDQIQVLSGDFQILPHYIGSSSRPPHNSVSIMFLHLEKVLDYKEVQEKFGQMALQLILKEYSPHSVIFHINPVLRCILGENTELNAPNYSKSEDLSLYFRNFLRVVAETLSQVNASYEKRRDYHLGLFYELTELDEMSVTPFENDIPHFTQSSYLIEFHEYPAMMVVETPSHGSDDPKVSLRTLSGNVREVNGGSAWDIEKTLLTIVNCMMDLKENHVEL